MNVCLSKCDVGERIGDVMLVDIRFSMYENGGWVFVWVKIIKEITVDMSVCLFE